MSEWSSPEIRLVRMPGDGRGTTYGIRLVATKRDVRAQKIVRMVSQCAGLCTEEREHERANRDE